MKKLVLTALAAVLVPTLVSAQGTVQFSSVPTTDPQGPYQKVVRASDQAVLAGTTAQLWWSPDNIVAYTFITPLVATSTSSGRITTGAVIATTGAATPGGTTAWFYVYGENLGAGLTGATPHFNNPTANGALQPPPTPPFLTGWDSSVGSVQLVPEPSTIALAGLGVGALLLFRRRK